MKSNDVSSKSAGAVRAQTARIRAQMKDLPADVQASIEQHCAENNDGARAGSHSRQAMTERALSYQAKMGKWPGRGMFIDPCLAEQVELDKNDPVGPLDVYSAERWDKLQAQGYVWIEVGARARNRGAWAVPVSGDPAYKGQHSVSKTYAQAAMMHGVDFELTGLADECSGSTI